MTAISSKVHKVEKFHCSCCSLLSAALLIGSGAQIRPQGERPLTFCKKDLKQLYFLGVHKAFRDPSCTSSTW